MGIKRRYAAVKSPLMGSVSTMRVATGAIVTAGESLMGIEIMKMLHSINAPIAGEVEMVVKVGEMVVEGQIVAKIYV